MMASLVACGTGAPTDALPQPEENRVSSATTPQPQAAQEISLLFDEIEVTATLEDNETTQAFLTLLPMTLPMNRYADREYYAPIGPLPESDAAIPDFENGDITYYTEGESLAIFFANADSSQQSGLIRMGRITSDLSLFDSVGDLSYVTITLKEGGDANTMTAYDFSEFPNVEITGADLPALDDAQRAVLYQQARYCQAMTDANTDTMGEIASETMVFTHMSGRQQTRAEYFADVAGGSLRYFTIGIENPVVSVNGTLASVTYTSVLDANAYGARGTYRMQGTHWYENQNGTWIAINAPEGEGSNADS